MEPEGGARVIPVHQWHGPPFLGMPVLVSTQELAELKKNDHRVATASATVVGESEPVRRAKWALVVQCVHPERWRKKYYPSESYLSFSVWTISRELRFLIFMQCAPSRRAAGQRRLRMKSIP